MKTTRIFHLCLSFLALAAVPLSTYGISYSFHDINTPATPGDISAYLTLDVTDQGGGVVRFTIANTSGTHSGIVTGISIQDLGGLLGPATIINSASPLVSFETGGGANLPASFLFVEDASNEYGRKSAGGVSNGINPGESLGLEWTASFAAVINDLDDGDIRIGMHVQSLVPSTPGSQKVVNNGRLSVPDGGTSFSCLALGLALLVSARRFVAS